MFRKSVAIIICFAMCFILYACSSNKSSDEIKTPEQEFFKVTTSPIDKNAAPLKIKRSENIESGNGEYPIFSGSDFDAKINDLIKSSAESFAKSIGQSYDITCEVKYNDHGVLSLLFTATKMAQQNSDAAQSSQSDIQDSQGQNLHPDVSSSSQTVPNQPQKDKSVTLVYTVNINTSSGSEITLESLFNSDSNWQEKLKDKVSDFLVVGGYTKYALTNSVDVKPIAANKKFFLDNEKLVIIYDLYELTSYSAGMPQIPVLFSDIEKMISSDGAISAIINNNNGNQQ